MKFLKLIFLLFPLVAFGQTDVGYIYTSTPTPFHDTLLLSTELTRISKPLVKTMTYKSQKVVDKRLTMGMSEVYIPESDVNGANVAGSQTRVLIYQAALNADIKPEELLLIENLIKEIEKPGVYSPPTTQPEPVVVESRIDDDNTSLTYSGTWIRAYKGPGTNTATAWYNSSWTDEYQNDNLTLTHSLNSYVEYTFVGNKIEVIGEKRENHGVIKVTIDDVDRPLIDTYENTKENKPSVLYSESLPQGEHKIRVAFVSFDATKAPSRNSIVLDGFKVYKVQ